MYFTFQRLNKGVKVQTIFSINNNLVGCILIQANFKLCKDTKYINNQGREKMQGKQKD